MARAELPEALRQGPGPVVVEVWAPWCAPCKTMAPLLLNMEEQYLGRVQVLRVNADQDVELVRALGVFAVPTLILFQQGQEITRRVGAQSAENLADLFLAAASGQRPQSRLALGERLLRFSAGSALALIGMCIPGAAWLTLPAGLILFSAVHDRCPIWQALKPNLLNIVKRQ